jgi:hypothetical protein
MFFFLFVLLMLTVDYALSPNDLITRKVFLDKYIN